MPDCLSTPVIAAAVHRVFACDVAALKPGNVHRYAEGHDMTLADFEASAAASVPWLLQSELSGGQRLHEAVRATREVAGCNTNLGMLLLFVPLVLAAERPGRGSLRERLAGVLDSLNDPADAEHFFAAIRLAAPGGLGEAPEHDVRGHARVSILEAMCAAQHRDRIAFQYANGYADIYGHALDCLREYNEKWRSMEWALVACYLSYLSLFPDSHITRKHGEAVALEVRQQGEVVLGKFIKHKNPEEAAPLLLEFDTHLKAEDINPGTSADLAAACMLVSELDRLLAG